MGKKRKSTGKRQRFNVFKRDRFTCQYCGRTPPTVVLVLDHILPVAAGGETTDHNLITSCETCNQGKADELLTDVPQAIKDSLVQQIERREQLREYNAQLLEMRQEQERLARDLGIYWNDRITPETAGKLTFGIDRRTSVKRFLEKLPVAEIYDAIDIAFSRRPPTASTGYDANTFKYFCGVCWSKIKQREVPPA